MKLQTYKNLPPKVYVAFSGGVDSVAVALLAKALKRKVTLAFFSHGNAYSEIEYDFVKEFSAKHELPLVTATIPRTVTKCKEKVWREYRHTWFNSLDGEVLTGHHLDDATEWYIITALRGQGQFMEYRNKNVVKPMLLHRKQSLQEYVVKQGVYWIEDPSNQDVDFTLRNRVRHELLPTALLINPGLFRTVRKRILDKRLNTE